MNDPVWPKLTRLLDCVCNAITEADIQPVCLCGIVPGAGVAMDYIHSDSCDTDADGMAWVRLSNQFPTVGFPRPAVTPVKCGVEIALVAEIGMIRSMPISGDGEPPDLATYLAVAERQVAEAAMIRGAVLCCFAAGAILGTYVPVGPIGGAVGGYWTVSIPTLEDDD